MKKSEVIVEFKTEKGEFLLCKVDDDASDFYISGTGNLCAYKPIRDVVCKDFMDINGKYDIIGLVNELTEEHWKKIVDHSYSTAGEGKYHYYDYQTDMDDHETALDGAKSLLNSLEVYSKNPYGVVPPKLAYSQSPREQQHFDETINKDGIENWRKANERTGSWLLLKKN